MEAHRIEISRRRQRVLYLLLVAFSVRLAWALFDIQVLDHREWVEAAQGQQKKRVVIQPDRGRIFDRNGIPLAINREQYEIYLVPRRIEDPDRFVAEFTRIVPYDEEELRAKIARGGWYQRLLRGVERETVQRLAEADIEGVGVETYGVRDYPHGDMAAALLGRVDPDNIGIEGLELQYDDALRGRAGFAVHQRDALGREYPNFTYPLEPPVHGKDIYLTIDVGLQEIVEAALGDAVENSRAMSGSIVVVDPRTGEILALASRQGGEAPATTALNHAVVDQFEPGSTFKVVTLVGLYEENLAAPTDSVFCENGRWSNDGRILTDVHPYGWLSIEEVIEESSNICAAKLADRLGDERLYEYARRFGFGLPSGLDFPGEPRGLLRRPDQWSSMTSASVAMGYEVMVTSVQMAMGFAAIANGGELLRPYLVSKVQSMGGTTDFEGRPQRVRRVMSAENARLVTRALVRVVEQGTARSAQIDVLPVAGKTGTARKTSAGGYVRGRYTSSFAGFFPAMDPRYVVFVRIDEPVGAFYGGAVAAPVFRRAMESTLISETSGGDASLVGRMRSPDRVVWTVSDSVVDLPAWPREAADSTAGGWTPMIELPEDLYEEAVEPYVIDVRDERGPPEPAYDPRTHVKIPDLTGLSLREAIARASRLGIRLAFTGTGRLSGQTPEPGEVVPRGSTVAVSNP
ncbi:MAG TPA: penicillin-binding protein [Gemmatimonadota bacterium]|nr:penicillin-binding protein [Gemmatimonadota bacterium]